jgi:hypothetical protein
VESPLLPGAEAPQLQAAVRAVFEGADRIAREAIFEQLFYTYFHLIITGLQRLRAGFSLAAGDQLLQGLRVVVFQVWVAIQYTPDCFYYPLDTYLFPIFYTSDLYWHGLVWVIAMGQSLACKLRLLRFARNDTFLCRRKVPPELKYT